MTNKEMEAKLKKLEAKNEALEARAGRSVDILAIMNLQSRYNYYFELNMNDRVADELFFQKDPLVKCEICDGRVYEGINRQETLVRHETGPGERTWVFWAGIDINPSYSGSQRREDCQRHVARIWTQLCSRHRLSRPPERADGRLVFRKIQQRVRERGGGMEVSLFADGGPFSGALRAGMAKKYRNAADFVRNKYQTR